MASRILIVYASKNDSTEEIACAIGRTFAEVGLAADARMPHEVTDLAGYDAVVLGSPVYHGKLMPEIMTFARKNREELEQKPTAAFTVGLMMAAPTKKNVDKSIKAVKPLVDLLHPSDVGLFAGVMDYSKCGFLDKRLMKMMKFPEGDHRNWKTIEKWAKDAVANLTGT